MQNYLNLHEQAKEVNITHCPPNPITIILTIKTIICFLKIVRILSTLI